MLVNLSDLLKVAAPALVSSKSLELTYVLLDLQITSS